MPQYAFAFPNFLNIPDLNPNNLWQYIAPPGFNPNQMQGFAQPRARQPSAPGQPPGAFADWAFGQQNLFGGQVNPAGLVGPMNLPMQQVQAVPGQMGPLPPANLAMPRVPGMPPMFGRRRRFRV